MKQDVNISHLYVSNGHRFVGRHGKLPRDYPMEERSLIECVAGKGIMGDRFFDYKENFKGQMTLFSEEVYLELVRKFPGIRKGPDVFRRNVIISGVDLNRLIGRGFRLGQVDLSGVEEASPCYWMNQAFCEGAEEALRGRGGLRARILADGEMGVGAHTLEVFE